MHAASRLVDQLVEDDAAVADAPGGGQVVQALHMEVGGQPEGMCRGGDATDQRIDLRVAVAAGDLQRYAEQRADLLEQGRGAAQVAQVRGGRGVGDALPACRVRDREFCERKVGRELHRISFAHRRCAYRIAFPEHGKHTMAGVGAT
jgi:hypothetical protein